VALATSDVVGHVRTMYSQPHPRPAAASRLIAGNRPRRRISDLVRTRMPTSTSRAATSSATASPMAASHDRHRVGLGLAGDRADDERRERVGAGRAGLARHDQVVRHRRPAG
jgi:hypothetical protein